MNAYQNPYYQYQMPLQNMIQQPVQSQQTQIQNGGFISVRSIDEARNYPVAPGNFVTFKVEGSPIVMEKSVGFSQFDSPLLKTYKLVEIDDKELESPASVEYVLKSEFDELYKNIQDIQDQIEILKSNSLKTKTTRRKKEDGDNDDAE